MANLNLLVSKAELCQEGGGSERIEQSMIDLLQSKSFLSPLLVSYLTSRRASRIKLPRTLAHFSPELNFFSRNQFAAELLIFTASSAPLPLQPALINHVVD